MLIMKSPLILSSRKDSLQLYCNWAPCFMTGRTQPGVPTAANNVSRLLIKGRIYRLLVPDRTMHAYVGVTHYCCLNRPRASSAFRI